MTLQYKEDTNRFYVCIDDSNREIAEITFSRIGQNKATIDHTFVDISYRGQGIAEHLLERVVTTLEQEKREITPLCSFAAKKLSIK